MIGVFAHWHRHPRTGLLARRVWLAALLTLLLGWQAAALRHALAHLGDADPDGPALPAHAVCVLCVAYAGADGALAVTPLMVGVVMDAAAIAIARLLPIDLPAPSLPYQVRAPPLALA
jgi:hypothetical protein